MKSNVKCVQMKFAEFDHFIISLEGAHMILLLYLLFFCMIGTSIYPPDGERVMRYLFTYALMLLLIEFGYLLVGS